MKTQTNTDKATASRCMIQFAGEELADWAARQPKIGPANDRRIRAALETGIWLQDEAELIVAAVNQYEAHQACVAALRQTLMHAETLLEASAGMDGLIKSRINLEYDIEMAHSALAQLDNTKGE